MLVKKLFPLFIVLLLLAGCGEDNQKETITVSGHKIRVYVARTPSDRMRGFAGKKEIKKNTGMLFVFPDEGKRSFWMAGCNFDLDLAYINGRGVVEEIITMRREDPGTPVNEMKRYPSRSDRIKYALEMRAGWFREHGIKPGTEIDLKDFNAIY